MKKKTKRIKLDDVDIGQSVCIVTRYHDRCGAFMGMSRSASGKWFIDIRQADGALVAVPAIEVREILSM